MLSTKGCLLAVLFLFLVVFMLKKIKGIGSIRKVSDVVHMDAQIRDKARSSPAVGLLRALWTHFASAPFSAPVADFRGG